VRSGSVRRWTIFPYRKQGQKKPSRHVRSNGLQQESRGTCQSFNGRPATAGAGCTVIGPGEGTDLSSMFKNERRPSLITFFKGYQNKGIYALFNLFPQSRNSSSAQLLRLRDQQIQQISHQCVYTSYEILWRETCVSKCHRRRLLQKANMRPSRIRSLQPQHHCCGKLHASRHPHH
jgi:hypothetical protein